MTKQEFIDAFVASWLATHSVRVIYDSSGPRFTEVITAELAAQAERLGLSAWMCLQRARDAEVTDPEVKCAVFIPKVVMHAGAKKFADICTSCGRPHARHKLGDPIGGDGYDDAPLKGD